MPNFGFNLEWITKLKLPQILTKTAHQQQVQSSLQHPSKGLDSSSLNTTWFNNLPLFDEDKSLMLVLYLIESEAVPARYSFKQNIELLIFG